MSTEKFKSEGIRGMVYSLADSLMATSNRFGCPFEENTALCYRFDGETQADDILCTEELSSRCKQRINRID